MDEIVWGISLGWSSPGEIVWDWSGVELCGVEGLFWGGTVWFPTKLWGGINCVEIIWGGIVGGRIVWGGIVQGRVFQYGVVWGGIVWGGVVQGGTVWSPMKLWSGIICVEII